MSLTALHERPRRKNSHEYKPTADEVRIGRRFCCAVKFVERERDAILTRVALYLTEQLGRTHTRATVVQEIADMMAVHVGRSFDEALAWYWFRFVPPKHRKFVERRVLCEGEG